MEQIKIKKVIIDMLAQGYPVTIAAGGVSMVPFLWPGTSLRVVPCSPSSLVVGDVALFDRPGDILIAHRVVGSSDEALLFRGDSCLLPDGNVIHQLIVGKVVAASWGPLSYSVDGFCARSYRWFLFHLSPLSYLFNHALAWIWAKCIRLRSRIINYLRR